MRKEETKRIEKTFEGGNNKYYVYALCKKDGTPFYIGKGSGPRIFDHQNAAKLAKDSIDADNTLTEVEKEKKIKEQTKKIKEILNQGGDPLKVIVKWGLSANEAYMCESSLINLVEMIAEKGIKCSKLTNIVNGHATKSEKSSAADIKTKARTIEQFLGECAIPERGIEGIDSNVAFLKINELYSRCFGENGNIDSEKVKECTRGFWSVGARRRKKIEFLFALYKRRVVGIYRVVKVHSVADSKLIDFPSFPLDVRKIDKWKFTYASLMEAKRNLNACDYKVFLKDLKNEKMSKTKALKRFRQRVYFSVNDDVPKCIGEYVNTLLTKNNSGMFLRSQKSVRYNF